MSCLENITTANDVHSFNNNVIIIFFFIFSALCITFCIMFCKNEKS